VFNGIVLVHQIIFSRSSPLLPRCTPRAPPGDPIPPPTLPPHVTLIFAVVAGTGCGGPWYRMVLGEVDVAAISSMRLGLGRRGRTQAMVGAAFHGQRRRQSSPGLHGCTCSRCTAGLGSPPRPVVFPAALVDVGRRGQVAGLARAHWQSGLVEAAVNRWFGL
jgi:hypothetical protein